MSLPLASVMPVKSDMPVLSCYVLSCTLFKIPCSVYGRNMGSLPVHVIDSFLWKSYIYVINFIEVMNVQGGPKVGIQYIVYLLLAHLVCSQFKCWTHCILVFAQKQYHEFEMWCCRAEDWLCIFFNEGQVWLHSVIFFSF